MQNIEKMQNEIQQEIKQSYVKFAKDSVSSKVYNSKGYSTVKIDKTKLEKALQSPIDNFAFLQQVSNALMVKQGIYYRLIMYFSSLLTYDHILYPAIDDKKLENQDKVKKTYENSALYLDKMNLKFNLPYFTKKLFQNGEVFLYKLEDKKGIVYKEIPSLFCRICEVENGVFRYAVDFSKFNEKTILEFPVEFQSLYNTYQNSKSNKGKNKNKNETTTSWLQISNKGIAFPTIYDSEHSYPPFSFIFSDVLDIDTIKSTKKDVDKLDNSKVIHNQVPLGDNGLPAMDLELAQAYNNALKENLPEGIISVTNPFKTQAISLIGAGNSQKNNMLEDAIDIVFKDSGVSDMLFANNKASAEALKKSIMTDVQILYSHILPLYANYINYELEQLNSTYQWKIKLLEVSYFDRDDKMKLSKDSLAYGGSRMMFLALNGFSPLETINILKAEQKIGLDDLLIPVKTSHTISDSDKVGKPTAEETGEDIGEAGEKTREQQ